MAKGQMRVPKEKKKPKADKDKPKQLSAYKQAQMQGPPAAPSAPCPAKSPDAARLVQCAPAMAAHRTADARIRWVSRRLCSPWLWIAGTAEPGTTANRYRHLQCGRSKAAKVACGRCESRLLRQATEAASSSSNPPTN